MSSCRFGTNAALAQPLEVAFQGELRPEQKAAAEALLAHDTGVLAATTAFGKTVVAAWLIAQRGVNTLVLVHRQQLLDQWVERLSDVPRRARARRSAASAAGERKPNGHARRGADPEPGSQGRGG